MSLRTNEKVMLLRKEFGYSRVQLEDGQVGYMANEDIRPAPPPPPDPNRKHLASKNKKSGRNAGDQAGDYGDDLPLLDPNLGIAPDDMPLEPLPDLLPEPVDVPKIIPPPTPTPPPPPVKESLPEKHDAEPAPPVSTST